MATQKVNFVVCPNGVVNGKHRLSVLVVPRLSSGTNNAKLSAWPDFADWPAVIRALDFKWNLKFWDPPTGKTLSVPVTRVGEAPSSSLWTAIFAPTLPVRDFKLPQAATKEIIDAPIGHIADYLSDKYAEHASSPLPPSAEQLIQTYDALNLTNGQRLDVSTQMKAVFDGLAARGSTRHFAGQRPASDFTQLAMFHSPNLSPSAAAGQRASVAASGGSKPVARDLTDLHPESRPTAGLKLKTFDFHDLVASLGSHPQLMRKLGLIVELEFTSPFEGKTRKTNLWLRPGWSSSLRGGAALGAQLKTAVEIGPALFTTRPLDKDNPEISEGLLNLRRVLPDKNKTPEFRLEQVDVDGAALKTLDFVTRLTRHTAAKLRTLDRRRETAPPAFRSAGLAVVRAGRADTLRKSFERQVTFNQTVASHNPQSSIELFAEDLTRGFAFDVFDERSGQWYSLCRRVGTATLTAMPGSEPIALGEDEGWVGTTVGQSRDLGDQRVRVAQTIGRWANGWSMVTPRPGARIDPDDQLCATDPGLANVNLDIDYRTPIDPGVLPPQRFGRNYRMRARAVDLAGNRISVEQANARGNALTLGPSRYLRHEPVQSPMVIPRAPLSEGESVEVIVLRSNVGTAPNQTPTADRHVFPASIDQFRAETHGSFDTPAGLDPDIWAQVAARENGAFDERDGDGNFVHADAKPDPAAHGQPYLDNDKPIFVVEGGAQARMPSLPDPVSAGAAFQGLPGASGGLVVDFYRSGGAGDPAPSWPDVRPLRLQVFEPNAPVAPEQQTEVLRIGLPKGDDVQVRLSSSLRNADIDVLGPWAKVAAGASGGQLAQRRALAAQGRYWALTPARIIRLVHAVRQPLRSTAFSSAFALERGPGDTSVRLVDQMLTSRKSTESVDISASWTEVQDILDTSGPEPVWHPRRMVQRSAHVVQKRIPAAGDPGRLAIAEDHRLGHTRHVPEVAYSTVATTRFKEFFTERKQLSFGPGQTRVLDSKYTGPAAGGPGVVPDSEIVTNLSGDERMVRGTHYTIDYTAGTITRLPGTNRAPTPTAMKATYVVPPITQQEAPVTRRVLSSARPAAPKLLYAVPNFKWERADGAETRRSKRGGGSLRVYMERPWWSSGEDEQLGVVCFSPLTGEDWLGPAPELEPYVTRRGQDPLWRGNAVAQLPRASEFTAATRTALALSVEEVPGARVAVAGHEVGFDLERRLVYCDIDIKPGSAYTPFVRLALARYQPHSISGVALSRVVLLDYMQLFPDRVATLTRELFSSTQTLSVSGRSHGGGKAQAGPNEIVAQVERRRAELPQGDDAVGWEPVPGRDPVTLGATTNRGATTWTATITTTGLDSGRRHRVLISEYERMLGPDGQLARRLVYADAIEL